MTSHAARFGAIGPAAMFVAMFAAPLHAADTESVALAKCAQPFGSIAVVDGDTQGWTAYGLGSPRDLIAAMAAQSGCFTLQDPASGKPANFLMNIIAGDKEEVDKGTELAKTAVVEGLVRSGAASQMLGHVPMGGAMLGAFSAFGGKKKTVAAGIRMINPATGATILAGSGTVSKMAYSFSGASPGLTSAVAGSGYAGNKDGRQLGAAFIIAFNSVIAQGAALAQVAAAPVAAAAAPAARSGAWTAVDTRMLDSPDKSGAVVRTVRAGTQLKPTGERKGVYVEMTDDFGSKGWVSVEDLK